MTSCEYAHDDGAYVLGALPPAERADYERHLADCQQCREAVAEIAVLPGLLGRLDPAGLDLLAEPPVTEPAVTRPPVTGPPVAELLAAARSRRRRERRTTRLRYAGVALVAACLALLLGLAVNWFQGTAAQPDVPLAHPAAMRSVRGSVPVTAEVDLHGTAWGTEVAMHCHYQDTGNHAKSWTFRLVAYGPDGEKEQVGSWVVGSGGDVTITGATRFTVAELTRLELTRYDGTALLAYDVP